MLFNSVPYVIFLPIVFMLYWFVFKKLRSQNILLLIASYIFYGWWDYRFLLLIATSTLIDYSLALKIQKERPEIRRKIFLYASIVVNIIILGYFKYFNFFIESFIELGHQIGFSTNVSLINIVLPVGISFYTFQTLSYTIDVYRKHVEPTKDIVIFATYVSFFPQLVAGPIERAKSLLPQFNTIRKFCFLKAKSGVQLIIWGLFQKIVIADNCATYVNTIFDSYESLNSLSLILGAFYFSFQIYCDFAGYSNIAIGSARLFGFDLMRNFNYPYFSQNIGEFWRRWHISLSTWFRDYLYIPLGGSRGNRNQLKRNVIIIFLVSGLWHGANWTFIAWGGLHALYFIPIVLKKSNKSNKHDKLGEAGKVNLKTLMQIIFTFLITCIAWIFFRSNTISDSFEYLKRIFTTQNFNLEYLTNDRYNIEMVLLIFLFILIEWTHREFEHPLNGNFEYIKTTAILIGILLYGVFSDHSTFIYFQF